MTGPLVAEASLARTLGVPEGWRVAALIPVGYPAETPEAPRRRPLASLVRHVD
jgi:nitroreductase